MKETINKLKKIKLTLKIIIKTYFQRFLISISKYSNKPLNKPTSIIIDITQNCILHCQQCNLWKTKPEKQMTFDQAKIIIDRLHDWLGNFYLFFTGGEPFINKNLPEIIKYAQSIGVVCHVNSNAFLIDKNLSKKIVDSKLSSISISLDGAKASIHDFLRGTTGTYQKVIQAIRLLQNGPKIYINTVIMKPNVSELVKLISLSHKENVDGINFQCLLPTLASNDTVDDLKKSSLWPKFNDVKTEIKKINNLNDTQKNKLLATKEQLEQITKYYQEPIINNKNIICAAGINNFIIDRKGNVRLCFYLPVIGNIFESTAKDIWLNKKAQQQRKIIRKCQKTCKVIGCNKIDINRQIKVESQSYNF